MSNTTIKIVSPEQIKEMIASLTAVKPKPPTEEEREPVDVEIGKAYEFVYPHYKNKNGVKMRLTYVELEEINIQEYYDNLNVTTYKEDDEDIAVAPTWFKPKIGTTCLLCDIIVNKNSTESILNNKLLRENSYQNYIILIDNKFYLISDEEFVGFVKEVK